MASPFDKRSVVILLVVVILTAFAVVVLHAIRPPTTANVTIACQQVNFETTARGNNGQPVSLLATRLCVEDVRVSTWKRVTFRVPPAWAKRNSHPWVSGGSVTITPNSPNSRVELRSELEAFAVRDIFIDGRATLSWRVSGDDQRIHVQPIEGAGVTEVSVVVSTGDSLRLSLLECRFQGAGGETLYESKAGVTEEMVIPVSFATAEVNIVGNSGEVDMGARLQAEGREDPLVPIRGIEVANLNCGIREYTQAGMSEERNTLVRGSVRRPEYAADDEEQIYSGEVVVVDPAVGRLGELRVTPELVEASVVYRARSLTAGAFEHARRQLVRSRLDAITSNRMLLLIYTASLAVFGFVTNHLLKKKES
jgi:hypothetical protein